MALFDSLYNELHVQNQSILSSMFPGLNLNTNQSQHNLNSSNNSNRHIDNSQSSLLLSSSSTPTSASSHNLSSSSFKFSLINTVRKAFRKESKDHHQTNNKENHNSKANALVASRTSIPTVPIIESHTHVYETNGNKLNINGRMRSSTFDTPNTTSLLTKMTKNESPSHTRMDYTKHSKQIGSVENINNMVRYNNSNQIAQSQTSSSNNTKNNKSKLFMIASNTGISKSNNGIDQIDQSYTDNNRFKSNTIIDKLSESSSTSSSIQEEESEETEFKHKSLNNINFM